jgi:hypothetical protein
MEQGSVCSSAISSLSKEIDSWDTLGRAFIKPGFLSFARTPPAASWEGMTSSSEEEVLGLGHNVRERWLGNSRKLGADIMDVNRHVILEDLPFSQDLLKRHKWHLNHSFICYSPSRESNFPRFH